MKNCCIILFLTFAVLFPASAQTEALDSFWGLDYSMDKSTVDTIILRKNENKGMSVTIGKTRTTITNPVVDGEKFKYGYFDFYRGKLLAGYFAQKEKDYEVATVNFLRIREALTLKYGEPEVETADVITCYWRDTKKNVVQLSMNKEKRHYNIGLLYMNGVLNSHKLLDEQMGLK